MIQLVTEDAPRADAGSELPALYSVAVTAPEYDGHEGVVFSLFRHGGEPPFDPADYLPAAVKAAGPARSEYGGALSYHYVLDAIRELFTREEALSLLEYFSREYPHTEIGMQREEPWRWDENIMGTGAVPVGGPTGFYMFDAEPQKPPVSVWGYADLRSAKSGPYVEPLDEGFASLIFAGHDDDDDGDDLPF